ncbi:unnamed protein product (macronuclear) [Paramecium tetraurelia]|uniref:Chromatin-remodeling ATPase INO80 n=1 Tax=Paramecium tetraurelia TaxID=5888 RepID=A0DH08_PARTE|nr:uncharacterized protein GSPATT00002454001 [Paramecium tetraurelia]CAK82325.1 unnamed protein product [Paramecium tetraurelia]|eukprot:XP_001449722.1 hypothetical protein (macronuclear) [Paramecium tetraurelia strain d4-2]
MSSGEEEDKQYEIDQLLQKITEIENTRQVHRHQSKAEEPQFDLVCFIKRPPVEDLSLEEARLCYLENKRQMVFSKKSTEEKSTKHFYSSNNSSKIQSKLLTFFSKVLRDQPNMVERFLHEKYNHKLETGFEQKVHIGITSQQFESSFQPTKLPLLGYNFEDAFKTQYADNRIGRVNKQKQRKAKNECQQSTQNEYFNTIIQQELYEDPIEVGDQKKSWAIVVRNTVKIARFKAKFRQDFREFFKRIAYFAAKEARRRNQKCQKYQKDFMMRAKKLSKEAQAFWRKRDKELIEIKKRKEKLEQERKKKEEEEREQLLQQKRLEFLMKQSDIYAHFMAKKLGITLDNQIQQSNGNVEIDEAKAFETVQRVINDNRRQLQQFDGKEQENVQIQELKLDHNDQDRDFSLIAPPSTFHGDLKEYQLKGLRWLDNLYDQGINGILADEMGLGKTIQAIALLSHISSFKQVWGPFLVIAPSSTLHNWQQEIKKFCPSLKVLPYWGQAQQRKTIRKYFQQKNFGQKQSLFHVVVTSYNLVVSDNKIFNRVRWQYMILDEAQAIKNINSQRWQILLSFNARNRLLLTGTPIQNTMGELWALLHFIMPKFFDSFDQFQEWFSKDIEAHSQDQKTLNQHQLQRLHAILKPFMLRRLKKDVENEIGQKKEIQIVCEMTSRQAVLYKNVKSKLSIKEFFRMLDSKQKVDNLMNLVMQFRKICNHPELFERKPYKSPYIFQDKQNVEVYQQNPIVQVTKRNPIKFIIPKLVYDNLIQGKPCIFTAHYIYTSLKNGDSTFACFILKHLPFGLFQKNIFDLILLLCNFDEPKNLINYSFSKQLQFYISIAQSQIVSFECRSSSFYQKLNQNLYNRQALSFIKESQACFILPNSPDSLIASSSKLLQLDRLLKDLKQKQWRVLIFCQMTRMLDILEEYMLHKGYTYFRMDGQCQINDRRDMVNEFQQNDKIFAFLLSTRAGGLGITLTQADAVIFYDNDWNPTMDAQATDRAHRIGRTKDVYVYRLITKGTIEERIVKRAQQKQNVQSTVYSGGFQGDKFKPQEVFELLFDEQDMDETVANKFMAKGQKKKKKPVKQDQKEIKEQKEQQKDQNKDQKEQQEEEDIIEVDLRELEMNEKDCEDAD